MLVAVLTVVAAGCSGDDPASESIGELVSRGPGTRVALVDHVNVPWDRVCIFSPYTAAADIGRITEIDGAARHHHDIHTREDINLLIFIHENRVARSIAHPRDRGDFAPELVGKCYSRTDAVFLVRNFPAGRSGQIGPRS